MFQINADNLPPLEAFPYLGRTIAYNNSDWSVVYQNLKKVHSWWGIITRVLVDTVAAVRDRGVVYKAAAQLLLQYIS